MRRIFNYQCVYLDLEVPQRERKRERETERDRERETERERVREREKLERSRAKERDCQQICNYHLSLFIIIKHSLQRVARASQL